LPSTVHDKIRNEENVPSVPEFPSDWSLKPQGVPYAVLGDPQSLNLYVYVRDNPVTDVDANGHTCTFDGSIICNVGNNLGPCPDGALSCVIPATPYVPGHGCSVRGIICANQPPPTNPDGSPKPPPSDVPKPPPGKPPGWKPGDPLVPNDWKPGEGTGDRGTRWDPKYPVPGQSQPNVSWDPTQGHWDYNDGHGNRTRYGPDGGQVDHESNPINMTISPEAVQGAVKVGVWGTVGAITIRVIITLGEMAGAL
jgi:hypothetical protein